MPAERVADGIWRFRNPIVNWYVVEADDGLTVVDAGLPPDGNELLAWLREQGRPFADVKAVVLTHAHIDHVGFAERARQAGARVYLHEADAPLVKRYRNIAPSERSPLAYARHRATRQVLFHTLRTAAFRSKVVREVTTYADGEMLPVPGSPHTVHCPGHTYGHCGLHLSDRDVLFTGDALVTYNPYTGRAGPQIVARAATADSARALRSLNRLAETGATTLLPGHGDVWTDGAAEAVRLAHAAGAS